MQKIQITVLYQSNDNCSKRENMRQVRDRRQNKKIKRIGESLGTTWKDLTSVLWWQKKNTKARHREYLHKIIDEHYSRLEK